jgi:hypothetical protein
MEGGEGMRPPYMSNGMPSSQDNDYSGSNKNNNNNNNNNNNKVDINSNFINPYSDKHTLLYLLTKSF